MDKAVPPLPALVLLELIGNLEPHVQEIVCYRMLLEIISLKKKQLAIESRSRIWVVLLLLYIIEKQVRVSSKA